jgi:hypothetical protein
MKNTLLTLLVLSFPLMALSQSEELLELDKEKVRLEETLKQQKEYTLREENKIKKELEDIETKKKQLAQIENYEQNFGPSRIQAIAEITESIKDLSFVQKIGSKASFYKCLRSSLENGNKLTYDHCYNSIRPKLNKEELEQAQGWKLTTGQSMSDLKVLKESLPHEIRMSESMLTTVEANRKYSEAREQIILSSLKILELQNKELNLLPSYSKFTNCDGNTPEINLEEKVPYPGATFSGAFADVPRDNQDGLGTCYANAAKNLLVGVSEGKDVASFLDVALSYKESFNEIDKSGLDGGLSCLALEALKKKGYCPQEFSPLETGERNTLAEGLFNMDAYTYMATNVNILREFLGGLSNFEKSKNPVNGEILKKSQVIVQRLKKDASIHLPLPIIRRDIPEEWKIRETYHMKKDSLKGISEKEFLAEYKKAYKEFYPIYMKAVLEKKNQHQVFQLYTDSMTPFFSKYNITDKFSEYKTNYLRNSENDFKDPALAKKLRNSIDFLKDVMNQKDQSDAEFILFCSNSGNESMIFLGALEPLIEKLRQDKLNEEILFDKEGKFRSSYELMQLTVAPACINPENRKELPEFSCSDGYDTMTKIKDSDKSHGEKVKMLRQKVVLSLAQGYPLGNSYPTSPGSGHINTIVGIRFNKQSGACEYRIRESQTGTSSWLLEGSIFNKINALTEVRRSE